MAYKRTGIIVIVLLALLMQGAAFAQSGRVVKSAIFPGMGQLADDQKVRGLGYMAGEALVLTMLFTQYSYMESSSRETYVLKVKYDMATTYEQRVNLYENRRDANNKYFDSRRNVIVLGGVAALLWGWNIADAVLFAPQGSADESLFLKTIRQNLALSGSPDQAGVSYTFSF